jgi:L-ribulokinase
MKDLVIGIDYGTDSCRALIVDTATGEELGESVVPFPRWSAGNYCDAAANQFRQHPKDYLEALEAAVKGALANAGPDAAEGVRGIAVDTTGSTPCAVDSSGTPLALTPGFEENPNAMFVLWKDHTAIAEAEEINTLARSWGGVDYTKFEGGIYSSEWFWAKVLHVMRADESVRAAAASWVEHSDWVPAFLTGKTDPATMYRSRCSAGHKAMWHEAFDGLPSDEFLSRLDPLLAGMRDKLYRRTDTAEINAGTLNPEWAGKLGLSTSVVVGGSAFDAHIGAVGGQITEGDMVKVIGTSTCDMIVTPPDVLGDKLVKGICGQVDGSVLPGMIGLEAGQSAFGDVYAWFTRILMWPVQQVLGTSDLVDVATREKLVAEVTDKVVPMIQAACAKLPIDESVVALDWLNGRRTPDADQRLKGAIAGLSLGTDAPRMYRALVESTAFGARAIMERFQEEGVQIKRVIGIGGVARKSALVMQILADVMNRAILVSASDQAVALGAAMVAAVAAGIHPNVPAAQDAMGAGFESTYEPNPDNVAAYDRIYAKYRAVGAAVETLTDGGVL